MEPRLVYEASPANKLFKHAHFSMDAMGATAGMSWKTFSKGSLDIKSGFHHVMLHPDSWSLFGV